MPGTFSGFDRYDIHRQLGSGGMGVVYEALDRDRNTLVALKTLKWLDPAAIAQFKNEFRALADVSHPNLVSLYELVVEHGQLYFTMELVRGVNFIEWIRPSTASPPTDTPSKPDETLATVRLQDVTGVAARGARTVVRSVRPEDADATPIDVRKLRDALRQLAEGVAAVHSAGLLHRDLKPSNVLVTDEGRIVVLDFGLVTDALREGESSSDERRRQGTPRYMSPEQGAQVPLTAASDWYSVGVMLYQALTGTLPFVGGQDDVLMDKQQFEPPPPRQIVADVPEDLDALCAELLRRDPGRRPVGDEVLRRLGSGATVGNSLGGSRTSGNASVQLVGRETQLDALRKAAADVQHGHPVLAFVHGDSGMGKTALVRRFLEQVGESEQAIVLRGRCYERESVPFKGLDSLIDSLSGYLSRLPEIEAEGLMPRYAAALARVFPVMRQVDTLTSSRRRPTEVGDPHELRRRAFAALRELLERIADRQLLILTLDDLQWADPDSAALLAALLRPPEAPRLLLVGVYRPDDRPASSFFDAFARHTRAFEVDTRDVEVGALSEDQARRLAELHLQDTPGKGSHAARIASESAGSPFFVEELTRHVLDDPTAEPGQLSLNEAVRTRLNRLPDSPASLLASIAVAGRPMLQATVFRAARVSDPAALSLLRAGSLVRTRSVHGQRYVEPYHDRIRETAVARLDEQQLARCHRGLANALEATANPDPEALAGHLLGAGEHERAATFATAAAQRATAVFAFARAARLYEMAIQMYPAGKNAELVTAWATALAQAGKGARAAQAYLDAAQLAPANERIDLERRAAHHFLQSGHVERGQAVLDSVLAAVNMKRAATPRRAVLSLVASRAKLLLRGGLRYRRRDEHELPASQLRRIDIAHTAGEGLAMVDGIRGADFVARSLIMALRAGEPRRLVRAFIAEALFLSRQGEASSKRAARANAEAVKLAQELDDPVISILTVAAVGIVAFHEGRWPEAVRECRRAEETARALDGVPSFDRSMLQLFLANSLSMSGEIGELCRRIPRIAAEADARGDRFTSVSIRTMLGLYIGIAADDPARAHAELADALDSWPADEFHIQHASAALAAISIDIYAGDGARALERCDQVMPDFQRTFMLRVQIYRVFMAAFRGRAALQAAEVAGDKAMMRIAEAEARGLTREGVAYATGFALSLRAGLAALRGNNDKSRELARSAERIMVAEGMRMFAAAARHQLGVLVGGDEGAALLAEADAYFVGEGFVNPKRMAVTLMPGFR